MPSKAMGNCTYGFIFNPHYLTVGSLSLGEDACVFMDTETSGLHPLRGHRVGGLSCLSSAGAQYLPFRHSEQPAHQVPQVIAHLKEVLANPNLTTAWFNAKFDLKMLLQDGVEVAGPIHDVMIMAHIVDENRPSYALKDLVRMECSVDTEANAALHDWMAKAGTQCFLDVPIDLMTQYACEDVVYTKKLFDIYWPIISENPDLLETYTWEVRLLRALVDIELRGICVDVPRLQSDARAVDVELLRLQEAILEQEPEYVLTAGKNKGGLGTRSSKINQAILIFKRGLPVLKRTPSGAPSFDKDVLDLYATECKDPFCNLVREYNLLSDLRSTFITPWLEKQIEGVLYTELLQTRVVTGRLSSSPNLQNIPAPAKKNAVQERVSRGAFVVPDMRSYVQPRPGFRNFHIDYSGQEIRIFIHYANDSAYAEAVRSGVDPHAYVAALMLGIPIGEVTAEQRKIGKTLNFAILYGAGLFKVAVGLSQLDPDAAFGYLQNIRSVCPREFYYQEDGTHRMRTIEVGKDKIQHTIPVVFLSLADDLKNKYAQKFPSIDKLNRQIAKAIQVRGFIRMHGGRRRRLSGDEVYKGLNSLVQGTGAEIIKRSMVKCHNKLKEEHLGDAHLLLSIHDENVFEIREGLEHVVIPKLLEIMKNPFENPLTMGMEFDVEVETPNWAQLEKWKHVD